MALVVPSRQVRLSEVSPTLWVGRLPSDVTGSVLVQMTTGNVTYYHTYGSIRSASENRELIREFSVFPRGDTIHLHQVGIDPDYSSNNLFQPLRWFDHVTTNLTIKGLKTLSYRSRFLRGSKSGFVPGNQRDELLRITVTGRVNDIEVSGTLQDSSVVLDDSNKNSILLKNDTWEGYFGEYWSEMTDLKLLSYSKRLDGIKGKYKSPNFSMVAMISESKGTAAHDRLYGKNSQGPYTVTSKPVVVNSEKVIYHGNELIRDTDYSFDYDLGQVTFKKEFIPDTDVFTIDYEYADSVYKKTFAATYAEWRATGDSRVIGGISTLGVGYQTQIDRGGAATANSGAVHPQTKHVMGAKASYQFLPSGNASTEMAVSAVNHNNTTNRIDETGLAVDHRMAWVGSGMAVKATIKQLSDQFNPIGAAILQPGYSSYGLDVGITPTSFWESTISHESEYYPKLVGYVQNKTWDLHTTIDRFGIGYYHRRDQDYSSTANSLDKTIERQTYSTTISLPWAVVKPSLRLESGENLITVTENFKNSIIQLQTQSTFGPEIQVSSGIEWLRQTLATGEHAERDTVGISTAIMPNPDTTVDGTFKFVNDSRDGQSLLSAINYAFRPTKQLRLNGNYNVETVQEVLGSTAYNVIKQALNFGVGWRPLTGLSLSYKFKPTFSDNRDLGWLRYDDRVVHQYGVSYDGWDNLVLALDHKASSKSILDKTKLPAAVVQQSAVQLTTLGQVEYRVDERSSLRYTLDRDQSFEANLNTSTATGTTDDTNSSRDRHSIEYQIQFSPGLKLTSAYRRIDELSTQTSSTLNATNLLTQSAETGVDWEASSTLSGRWNATWEQRIDRSGILPDTYLVIPHGELKYRPLPGITIGGFLELTSSFSGQFTSRWKGSVYTKSDSRLWNSVDMALSGQVDFESERAPTDYDTFDGLIKVTLIF